MAGTINVNAQPVSAQNPLPVTSVASTSSNAGTGTVTSVNDTNVDGTILAANASRKGAAFFNDSTVTLYLLCAAGTSSSTNFTVAILAGGFFELPPLAAGGVYTGIIKGIWAADASGAVRVTEWT